MKQQFQEMKLRAESLAIIEQANTIITAYEAQGYTLTLRQLYYQFVSRDLLANTERNYKRLGEMISNGRLAGLIDWDAIEDRTRNLRGTSHWGSPRDVIYAAYSGFRIDKWANQPRRVEVWVEKDALVGVIERVCDLYDVDYFACRGYVSQSEMFAAGERLSRYISNDQEVHILHLGDHDPSGIDMTRDVRDRLTMFLEGWGIDINRLALNWEQIELYSPPPNPAKTTDSRFDNYEREFGSESWELDALEPSVIAGLIEENILALRDEDRWDEKVAEEDEHRDLLQRTSRQWDDVVQMLKKDDEA